MVDYLVWVWLGVIVASAALEFITMEMVSIWFTFAGIITIILALCGVVWWVQLLVFCGLALILLLSLRKLALKYLLKNDKTKTNADGFVGNSYKLIEPIAKNTPGAVKINGVVWTAVSENGEEIAKDEVIVVVKIDGNKLIVKEQKGE